MYIKYKPQRTVSNVILEQRILSDTFTEPLKCFQFIYMGTKLGLSLQRKNKYRSHFKTKCSKEQNSTQPQILLKNIISNREMEKGT
jgi:hypothetical protein